MFETTRQRIENAWIFALAASTAPLTFMAAGGCGLACGGCPLGGACLLTSPAVFGLVLVIKAQRRASAYIRDRFVSKSTDAEDEAIPVLNLCPRRDKPT